MTVALEYPVGLQAGPETSADRLACYTAKIMKAIRNVKPPLSRSFSLMLLGTTMFSRRLGFRFQAVGIGVGPWRA